MNNPAIVQSLLQGPTPQAWVEQAVQHQDVLLVDQANCEKKAASSAIAMMYRNEHDPRYLNQLSRLAREELRHFEIVTTTMRKCGFLYSRLGPSRYAKALHQWVRTSGQVDRFVDQVLVAAMIEARSCERIGALVPALTGLVNELYVRLHESEGRHFHVYFELALTQADETHVLQRLDSLRELELTLIASDDPEFRFHSGIPISVNND